VKKMQEIMTLGRTAAYDADDLYKHMHMVSNPKNLGSGHRVRCSSLRIQNETTSYPLRIWGFDQGTGR
jgi:hypothetical protein